VRKFLLLLVLVTIALLSLKKDQPVVDIADQLYINGHIWTADPSNQFVEALAVKGNRIIETGTNTAIHRLKGPATKIIDLKGRLMIPGFNDGHVHFLSGSLGLTVVDLVEAKTMQEALQMIANYANKHPELPWITGGGWQYSLFPGGLPTKEMLDVIVPDRPVYLKAYDGHSGWANSKALSIAGVTKETVFKGFGELVKDKNGEPTGAFKESATGLVTRFVPGPDRNAKFNALLTGLKYAASLGITSIQNASGSKEEYELYDSLLRIGKLSVRTSIAFSAGRNPKEEDIQIWKSIRSSNQQQEWLKTTAVKFLLDGVIESHTAVMIDPYSDLLQLDSIYRGQYAIPIDQYEKWVNRLDREGFQIYTHAIGDASVRSVLDAYEKSMIANGKQNKRHRIEHIEMTTSVDIERFNKLGVLPSMQPIHADPGTIDVWSKAIGEKRLPLAFPWASLLQQKSKLVFGSDWPACISLDPIRGIHNAVNRMTTDGKPVGGWIPAQRISLEEALYAYTAGAAYGSFDEQQKGQLKKGFLADFIVLSQDLFKIKPENIHTTKVELTVVDGKEIFRKVSF
jgi:predicted amidohydrolase YtcJ